MEPTAPKVLDEVEEPDRLALASRPGVGHRCVDEMHVLTHDCGVEQQAGNGVGSLVAEERAVLVGGLARVARRLDHGLGRELGDSPIGAEGEG